MNVLLKPQLSACNPVRQFLRSGTKPGCIIFADVLDTGFADVLASEDLDTITSFNASLKFSQRIRIKQRTREEFGQAIPSPVSGSAAPGQTPITAKGTDQFVDNLVKKTQGTQSLREQFGQSVPADLAGKQFEDTLGGLAGLLKAVLDKLADQQDFGTSKRKLATHVRAEFVQKLKFSLRLRETLGLGPQSQQPAEHIPDQADTPSSYHSEESRITQGLSAPLRGGPIQVSGRSAGRHGGGWCGASASVSLILGVRVCRPR